jgi:hypothetical protein
MMHANTMEKEQQKVRNEQGAESQLARDEVYQDEYH